MIIYSIVPSEVIFGGFSEDVEDNSLEISYMGEKVQVMPVTNSQYVIRRVISTSPKAFLNPALQPGTIINARL